MKATDSTEDVYDYEMKMYDELLSIIKQLTK